MQRLRDLTRETGTLLLIDETHTISTGPGGYTRKHGLEPDLFVLGKPVAGGVPASVWGMSAEVAQRYGDYTADQGAGLFRHRHDAVGQSAAVRRHARDARRGDDRRELRPHGTARGAARSRAFRRCRQDIACPGMSPGSARGSNSSVRRARFAMAREAQAAHAPELEAAIHVALVNRGVLIAPFHNMMLVSPATTARQVDRLVAAFGDIAARLAA